MGLESWKPLSSGFPCAFRRVKPKTSRANTCFKFLGLLTTCRMVMAPGRNYCALAILLAFVDIQPGGCINITSLVSQEGKQLKLICTVWNKKEEAEGFVVFLCKDRYGDCSPETSLKQLRLKRDAGVDEKPSELVFTINQATPLDSGTYQCCAQSQKPDIHLQGHFFSILVTESGNYTVTRLKQRQHSKFSHSEGTVSSGFLQAKVWVTLVSSLVTLQAL
ncbi:CD160 antigen isoform X2 [Nycticebus coucang]|uniref:CD160 antigen isoform X2 n=1 Tax=Nycticebus coucang TaxID=9470 RepID=UPI00234C5C5E|nr:CD160 antigen isoform X2 [Nycticebus coucang]